MLEWPFQGQKPQILTSNKSMEVMIYLLQIFFYNGLLLLGEIHKVWRGCKYTKFEEGVWYCFRDMIFWNYATGSTDIFRQQKNDRLRILRNLAHLLG